MKTLLILTSLLVSGLSLANENSIQCQQNVEIIRHFDYFPDYVVFPYLTDITAEGSDRTQALKNLETIAEENFLECISFKNENLHGEANLQCKKSKISCNTINQ
jgi:hypothetical protein